MATDLPNLALHPLLIIRVNPCHPWLILCFFCNDLTSDTLIAFDVVRVSVVLLALT